MKFWLMKSEAEVYSIDNLKSDKRTLWEGVRNYQARNFMTQDMGLGDQVLFYHSNSEPTGIAGLAKISGLAVPDPTQFERKSDYFDPKASLEKPTWFCVQLEFVQKWPQVLSLSTLKLQKELRTMPLLQKGQRLSVQPVSKDEFEFILKLSQKESP